MAPTLADQDRLIVNKLSYQLGAPQRGDISVSLKADADEWVLKVADQGQGLPETEEAPTKGIGMRLVMSLVAQIHGDLRVHAERGAVFEIRLPGNAISPVDA